MVCMKQFAPIIIPACSRPLHIKKCIESLARNTYADKTDLIISVDYPPYDDMMEGYNKVVTFLSGEINGFKSVEIIFQKENLGFYDNIDFLTDLVKKRGYKTFIYSEEDLEFSPCFLEYINKGLELFENDERVFSICGYMSENSDETKSNNIEEVYAFSPWGYGTWVDRYYHIIEQITKENFGDLLAKKEIRQLACNRGDEFRFLFEATVTQPGKLAGVYNRYYNKRGELGHIDQTIGPIMCLEKMFSIHPKVNMVRNMGFDDKSGHTIICNGLVEYSKQMITEEKRFNYVLNADLVVQKNDYSNIEISYMPAKRAWMLRKMYLMNFKWVVRIVLYISYKIGKMRSYIVGYGKESYSWRL